MRHRTRKLGPRDPFAHSPVRPVMLGWVLILLMATSPIAAQAPDQTGTTKPVAGVDLESSTADEALRPRRLVALGALGVTAHYIGYQYFERAWYQGEKRDRIRWLQDWSGETYVNVDKGGHFMSGLFMSSSIGQAFEWTGLTPRKAAVAGALTSWVLLFEVEMRDAYFDQWGFSIPDFVANTAGVSVPLLHAFVPATQAVGFKFSWFPSRLYRDYDARLAADLPRTRYAIDDYEGMTFWTTFAVESVLRGRARQMWPDWLGLALGYGATGMHGSNVKSRGRDRQYPDRPEAQPEIILSLDADTRYLPGKNEVWSLFKEQLNWLHLPAPAIRVYPDLRFYLLYM